jgi:hypothetical protein
LREICELETDSDGSPRQGRPHGRTDILRHSVARILPSQVNISGVRVTVALSLDGQRLDVRWAVRERIGGLVEEQSETFQLRYDQDGRLYFSRGEEPFRLQEISKLIVSLADRF